MSHGFVARIEAIWPLCDLMICPTFSGGGVSIKSAEAIYNEMPVLARPFAARGLQLPPDPAIVVLDRACEWVGFLRSPAAREFRTQQRISPLARIFGVDTYREAVHQFVRAAVNEKSGKGTSAEHGQAEREDAHGVAFAVDAAAFAGESSSERG